jgi:hypothetical protein
LRTQEKQDLTTPQLEESFMLQDTALGGATLAHLRQREMRNEAAASTHTTRERRTRPLRIRPANQPSIITSPTPAQLRRMWGPVAGS